VSPIPKDTEITGMIDVTNKILRKKTTTSIPQDVLDRLKSFAIVEREPPYSIIERLLDEHDLKTMQRVVTKRVR
jgi:hypothetical protein